MLKKFGQVAGPKALIFVNSNTAASLVDRENSYLSVFFSNYSVKKTRNNYPRNSILFNALTTHDFNDEDIFSESIILLEKARASYEEKNCGIDFMPFAITYVREGIKTIKSQNTHTSSSDLNELIHNAIRIIKKNNNYSRLTHQQITKLIDHFNLDLKKGYKKIVEFENIQQGTISIEVKNYETEDYYNILDNDKLDYNDYFYNKSKSNDPESVFEKKEYNKLRPLIIKFLKTLNKKEKIIFFKRIFNSREIFFNLKEVASIFRVSPQSINKIEKKLKNNLKSFFQYELVDKKNKAVK